MSTASNFSGFDVVYPAVDLDFVGRKFGGYDGVGAEVLYLLKYVFFDGFIQQAVMDAFPMRNIVSFPYDFHC